MKTHIHTESISTDDWNFEVPDLAEDALIAAMRTEMGTALKASFEAHPVDASLTMDFALWVRIPAICDDAYAFFQLDELVEEFIELCGANSTIYLDDSPDGKMMTGKTEALKMASNFRRYADEIERAAKEWQDT